MAVRIVSKNGNLLPSSLSSLSAESSPVSVVAAIGACGVGQSPLLNAIFGTSFASGSERHRVQGAYGIWGQYAAVPEVAVLAEEPRQMVVFDVEGYDSSNRGRVDLQQQCLCWALALADVIVWTVRMSDLVQGSRTAMEALKGAWIEEARLVDRGLVNRRTFRRMFIVVVKDYEHLAPRQHLISTVLERMESIWVDIPRGAGGSSSRLIEAYDFEFVALPCEAFDENSYNEEIGTLSGRLMDPAADDYLFESGAYRRTSPKALDDQGPSIWEDLKQEAQRDTPGEIELNATLVCNRVMTNVYDKFEKSVRPWRRRIDGGSLVDGFGKECAELMSRILSMYESGASEYQSAAAFSRKRSELRERLDTASYDMFAKQTLLVREEIYSKFKEKLLGIDMNPKVEKEINRTVRQAIRTFSAEVSKIRPRGASWRFDNESNILSSHMREDATDRLQEARLRGLYKPAQRQSIALSFHYLNPAPFGMRDSRYERLSFDDQMVYNVKPSTRVSNRTDEALEEPVGPPVPILDTPDQNWDKSNKEFVYKEEKRVPGLLDARKPL